MFLMISKNTIKNHEQYNENNKNVVNNMKRLNKLLVWYEIRSQFIRGCVGVFLSKKLSEHNVHFLFCQHAVGIQVIHIKSKYIFTKKKMMKKKKN